MALNVSVLASLFPSPPPSLLSTPPHSFSPFLKTEPRAGLPLLQLQPREGGFIWGHWLQRASLAVASILAAEQMASELYSRH